jgi:hypothetical protein
VRRKYLCEISVPESDQNTKDRNAVSACHSRRKLWDILVSGADNLQRLGFGEVDQERPAAAKDLTKLSYIPVSIQCTCVRRGTFEAASRNCFLKASTDPYWVSIAVAMVVPVVRGVFSGERLAKKSSWLTLC